MKKLFIIFIFTLLGHTSVASMEKKHISPNTLGKEWPLTVNEGYVACVNNAYIFIDMNNTHYALNGIAMSNNKYKDIEPVWKDAEPIFVEFDGKRVNAGPPKVNLGPLLTEAEKLCN